MAEKQKQMKLTKKHHPFFVIALLLVTFQPALLSQQLPIFNQARENLNPAHISNDYFKFFMPSQVNLSYRHQWTNIKGAPRTIMGSFLSYYEDARFLFGVDLVNDKTGPTGFTGLYGRAGYAFELNRDFLLTAGLRVGLVQYRVQGSELNFLDAEDIANNDFTKLFPDFSFGAMLYYKDHYYMGFSVPQLFELELTFKTDVQDYKLARVRHYYSILGGRIDLGDGTWIEGISEFRYVPNIPFYFNGRLQFDFRDLFWVAGNVSSAKEFGAEFGILRYIGTNSNLLRIAYGFSHFFQTYGSQFGVVHELRGSYSF